MDGFQRDKEIAKKVLKLLEEAPKQKKPKVSSWSEVANTYLRTLYW